MTVTQEQFRALEDRVFNLETWAGPGQTKAFGASLAEFREEVTARLDAFEIDFSLVKDDISALKTDVAELKTDMAELKTDVVGFTSGVNSKLSFLELSLGNTTSGMKAVKGVLAEILKRLPERTDVADESASTDQ